mgnify:CR=1 FL=1
MNPVMIVTAVSGVLRMINQFLPLIGGSNAAAVGSVINTLTDIAPLVTDQIGATYTGVKNIVDALSSHPATTEDQLKALRAFDKQVDDAWDAIEAQIDPDGPASA